MPQNTSCPLFPTLLLNTSCPLFPTLLLNTSCPLFPTLSLILLHWYLSSCRGGRSLTEEVSEQPNSNVPLVELHYKLVLILWIIMGLDMKSIKPLTVFDTSVSQQ